MQGGVYGTYYKRPRLKYQEVVALLLEKGAAIATHYKHFIQNTKLFISISKSSEPSMDF